MRKERQFTYTICMLFMMVAVSLLGGALAKINAFALPADPGIPKALIAGKHTVKLEVASTPQQIERGLMFRTSLPEEQGMVFIFEPEQAVNFWMCHTLIPLDMLFIHNGKIAKIFEEVPPCKDESCTNCALYPPQRPGITVNQVLELSSGWAKRHHVKEGDAIEFSLN